MPDFRISDDALLDIGDIFVFGAEQFGRVQAEKYLALMRETFTRLANNPNIGRAVGPAIQRRRRHGYGTHVVFYRPTETGIFILRVIHTARLTGTYSDDLA